MQYPCEMFKVMNGKIVEMRFKQDAPVGKPGWCMDEESARQALNPVVAGNSDNTAENVMTAEVKPIIRRRKRSRQ